MVGRAAISVLHALGAWVTVMDINIGTLRDIGKQFNEEVNTQISNRYNLKKILPEIDVVYNCVRWPKDAKEYMIDREMVRSMEKGSVIVDISNDYGAIETFHETTHENPRYIEEGVVHYCVSNIPGAISVYLDRIRSIRTAALQKHHQQWRGAGMCKGWFPAPQLNHLQGILNP